MNQRQPAFAVLALKTIVVHTVTYFVCGVLAFLILDYETGLRSISRGHQENDRRRGKAA